MLVMGAMRALGEWLGVTEPVQQTRDAPMSSAKNPPPRHVEGTVTVEQALSIAAVYRAVAIWVNSIKQMDLAVYRGGMRIPTPPLIRQPDPEITRSAFIGETVYSLATTGEAMWLTFGDPVQAVRCLPPHEVGVEWADEIRGRRRYRINGREVPNRRIRHLMLMHRPGQLRGAGPIQHGRRELYGAYKLREFADTWFDVNTPIDGYLATDQPLNKETSKQYAEAWKEFLAEHGMAVLGSGLKYVELAGRPAELQMVEVARAHVVMIARLFGIPPTDLIAELSGTSMTYQNVEQSNMSFLQKTLVGPMNEIEEHLTSLLPRGQSVQFIEDSLLRLDTITKWRVNKIKVDLGYTSGAELRRLDGLDPLPARERPALEAVQ